MASFELVFPLPDSGKYRDVVMGCGIKMLGRRNKCGLPGAQCDILRAVVKVGFNEVAGGFGEEEVEVSAGHLELRLGWSTIYEFGPTRWYSTD